MSVDWSTRESNFDIAQGRMLLEDMADGLEEFRLKGRRVKNHGDGFSSVLVVIVGDEHAQVELVK
jgi:hypothetical protein